MYYISMMLMHQGKIIQKWKSLVRVVTSPTENVRGELQQSLMGKITQARYKKLVANHQAAPLAAMLNSEINLK